MKGTCDIFGTIIDNHEDISNILLILLNHLIESLIDAGQLIEGNMILRSCISVWKIGHYSYFLFFGENVL